MAHQNVFRTREGGGAKPLVTLSPQTSKSETYTTSETVLHTRTRMWAVGCMYRRDVSINVPNYCHSGVHWASRTPGRVRVYHCSHHQ